MNIGKIDRKTASLLLANLFDHFDANLYSFMAPIMAPLFFPNQDPIMQLILAYSFLATSSITRPIGVFIFGLCAKHVDPWKILRITLIGVGTSSFLMGCLPIYETAGYYAAFMLLMTRILCNIFAAGEKTIADVLIVENKPYKDAIITNAWFGISIMAGCALASWSASIVSTAHWRIPFWLGSIVSVYALFLRYSNAQTKTNKKHVPGHSFSKPKFKALTIVAFTSGLSYVTYDLSFVLINNYVPLITSITRETMMRYNSILLILDAFIAILIAYLIRPFNLMRVKRITAFLLMISSMPLYHFMQNASLSYIFLARLWIIILGVTISSALTIWWLKLFQDKAKYFWIGISSAIGSALIGRSTSFICLCAWHKTHLAAIPGIYLSSIAFIVWLLTFSTTDVNAIET